jgi:tRNA(Ile)-lysidine synthase
LRRLGEAWPAERFLSVTTLVAVSGGSDSVALLRLLHACRQDHLRKAPHQVSGRLVVVHYNHRLRGAAAEQDQRFVESLCRELQLECVVGRAPEEAAAGPADAVSEAALRDRRYAFLDAVAHRLGARYVATGHTADDQVETVLHQLFRGSGPAGLAGIPPFRDLGADAVLVRPLLAFDRQCLRQLLDQWNQPWREDASNEQTRWQRNWLRRELLPALRQRYPGADGAIQRAAQTQRQWHRDLRVLGGWLVDESFRFRDPSARLEIAFDQADRRLRRRSILVAALKLAWDRQRWPRGGFRQQHWSDLAALIERAPEEAQTGERPLHLPGGLRARAAAEGLVVVERLSSD